MKNIIFLYTNLADYFFRAVIHLIEKNPQIRVTFIAQAYPFERENHSTFISFYHTADFATDTELLTLVQQKKPDLIYSAGWSNPNYQIVCRYFRKKIPIVLGMDNPWKNTLRQRVAALFANYVIHDKYTHAWVAGDAQYEFARRLNFPSTRIKKYLYTADNKKFQFRKKQTATQKKLIYVGRLVAYKRPAMLVEIFQKICEREQITNWTLQIIGAGELMQQLKTISHPDYTELVGAIAPNDLPDLLSQADAFCLPSKNEHWGVVIHEAALMGLPLILSDSCYAGSHFLMEGYNGYSFATDNKKCFYQKLKKMLTATDQERERMGNNSLKLAQTINQEFWAASLLSILAEN